MTAPTRIADVLGIAEGSRVWVVGNTGEANALLDPLPEGAETFEEYTHELDAALLLTDTAKVLDERLDEALPQLGSVMLVWICFPPADLEVETVQQQVQDYGWGVTQPVRLDETWSAVRIDLD